MLPRLAVTSVGIAVFLIGGAPAGALGDPAQTADLTAVVSVSGCPGATIPFDASAILVGTCVRVQNVVTNTGPDATTVSFQFSLPAPGAQETWRPASSMSSMNVPCSLPPGSGPMPVVCTVPLPAGGEFEYDVNLIARAPGVLSDSLSVAGSALDPNVDDNTSTWQTTVGCQVTGTAGDDTLVAGPGEAACGLGGDDTLVAELGAVGLFGGDGNDILVLGQVTGALALGGPGTDTASYANAPNGVAVCPMTQGDGLWSGGMASPGGGGATMFGIENITGSPFTDRLVGNSGQNRIYGGGGNDWIMGGGGDDVLMGGVGNDLFTSTDRTTDIIDGDGGTDRAHTDHRDHVTSAKHAAEAPFNDPCLG